MTEEEKQNLLKPPTHSFMMLSLGYNHYILPYAYGAVIAEALTRAETVNNYSGYSRSSITITPIETGHITYTSITKDQYIEWKLKTILQPGTN